MFLESIELAQMLPCLAEPGKHIVVGKPSRSLVGVLPYLATLPDIITYNPGANTLTFRRQRGFITLYADRVYITQVTDVDEGLRLLMYLTDAINTTWAHRQELSPATTARRAPSMLDIWSQLPQTNCKQCGEATCMAFAVGLLRSQRILEECVPLRTDQALADRYAAIAALL